MSKYSSKLQKLLNGIYDEKILINLYKEGTLCNCSHSIGDHSLKNYFKCCHCQCEHFKFIGNLKYIEVINKAKHEEDK